LLLREVADPRLRQIFVTDVRVDREFAFADVFVSAVEGASRREEVLEGLEAAGGFLRKSLAKSVELRSFPKLRFHWDPTPEHADQIEKVLAELRGRK